MLRSTSAIREKHMVSTHGFQHSRRSIESIRTDHQDDGSGEEPEWPSFYEDIEDGHSACKEDIWEGVEEQR